MIVKNEEKYLERALRLPRILFDEIVILDTGSTDNTKWYAKEYGCKVFSGGDPMHKGQARTQSMNLATGDYVIILDADETIQNPKAVRAEIEKTQADVYYIRLAFMDGDKQTLSYSQARIFKKGVAEYKYRAHEVPVWKDGARVIWTDLLWEHRPPPERAEGKKLYALQRLLLDVKENPWNARPLYYLGRQYYYLQQFRGAIDTLKKYIQVGSNDTGDAWHFIAMSYRNLGKAKEAISAMYQAIAIKPIHREYWATLSAWYKEDKQPELAYACLRFVEKLPPPKHDYLWNRYYGADFYDSLALSAYAIKDYIPALSAGIEAIRKNPDSARLKDNLNYYIQKAR